MNGLGVMFFSRRLVPARSLWQANAPFLLVVHDTTPRSNRRSASATFSQQNKTRRPILMLGILPAVRQLWSVRRETGSRRNNSRSSINAASFGLDGAV